MQNFSYWYSVPASTFQMHKNRAGRYLDKRARVTLSSGQVLEGVICAALEWRQGMVWGLELDKPHDGFPDKIIVSEGGLETWNGKKWTPMQKS